MPPQGAELAGDSTGKTGVPVESGAESGALGARKPPSDPDRMKPIDADLAAVIDAWPKLPEATRRSILAMIRAAK